MLIIMPNKVSLVGGLCHPLSVRECPLAWLILGLTTLFTVHGRDIGCLNDILALQLNRNKILIGSLIYWVEFIVMSAGYQLCGTSMLCTWDSLFVAPPERRSHVI